jgi:hypothetical protein
MAVSVEEQIQRQLARLRMDLDVATGDEVQIATEIAHMHIDELLDQLQAAKRKEHSQQCQQSPTQTSIQTPIPQP